MKPLINILLLAAMSYLRHFTATAYNQSFITCGSSSLGTWAISGASENYESCDNTISSFLGPLTDSSTLSSQIDSLPFHYMVELNFTIYFMSLTSPSAVVNLFVDGQSLYQATNFSTSATSENFCQSSPQNYKITVQNLKFFHSKPSMTLLFNSSLKGDSNSSWGICGIQIGFVEISCSTAEYFFNGACVSSCPSSTYSDQNYCIECDQTCLGCSGPSNGDCTACPTDWALSSGYCYKNCPPGKYRSLESSDCLTCATNCSQCDGPSAYDCTACSSSFSLQNSSCVSACTSGFYEYTANRTCIVCNASCETCSSEACYSCKQGYYLFNGSCVSPCPVGYYKDKFTMGCSKCDSSCGACDGPSPKDCMACPEGEFLLLFETYKGSCNSICPGNNQSNVSGICLWNISASLNTITIYEPIPGLEAASIALGIAVIVAFAGWICYFIKNKFKRRGNAANGAQNAGITSDRINLVIDDNPDDGQASGNESKQQNEESKQQNEESSSLQPKIDQRLQCVICLNLPKSTIFIKCSHCACCEECANAVINTNKLCPLCRASVSTFLKVLIE